MTQGPIASWSSKAASAGFGLRVFGVRQLAGSTLYETMSEVRA
jgi:hypothetical protein